jgi:hypothetical protein
LKDTGFNRKIEKEIYRKAKRNVEKLLTYAIDKRRAVFSKNDHLKILIFASLFSAFAEGASKSLGKTPSADTLLKCIKSQSREKMEEAFESQLKENVNRLKRKRKLWKPVRVAIDWTDEMFYGDHENTPMVNGTKLKNGSSYAFQFLTVCILVDGERLVVGVLPLESRNELPEHTLRAIEKVRELEVKIRNVTIDAGFFQRGNDFLPAKRVREKQTQVHNPDANQPQGKEDEALGWEKIRVQDGRQESDFLSNS